MRKMRRKYTEGSGLITQLLSARFTLLEKWLPTNQRTNQQTDRQMDKASYRGAWTHRKKLLTDNLTDNDTKLKIP